VAGAAATVGPGRSAPGARRVFLSSAAGLAGLVVFGWVVWIRPQPPATLATTELIAILGRFRAPHHYLPSTFPGDEFVLAATLCGAGGFAWLRWWRAPGADRVVAARVAAAGGLILAAFVAGWLFVEVWPVRLVFVAQTFRLVFALKWLALLLVAQGAVVVWRSAPDRSTAAAAVLSLAGIGRVQPAVALAGQATLSRFVRGGLEPSARRRWAWVLAVVVAGAAALGSPREAGLLVVLGAIAWWLTEKPRGRVAVTAPLAVAAAVVVVLSALRAHPLPFARSAQQKIVPRLVLDDTPNPLDAAARWLAANTPQDAVVLTPPGGGRVRLVARRAVVADHRAFPWSDDGLREWYARIRACYGPTHEDADAFYAALDDAARDRLATADGATHAILPTDAPSAHPVAWQDARWKIVALR
jgi:hypothetical protein